MIHLGNNRGQNNQNTNLINAQNNQNQDERDLWIRMANSMMIAAHYANGSPASQDQLDLIW